MVRGDVVMEYQTIINLIVALIWLSVARYAGKSWDFALFISAVSLVSGLVVSFCLEAKQ